MRQHFNDTGYLTTKIFISPFFLFPRSQALTPFAWIYIWITMMKTTYKYKKQRTPCVLRSAHVKFWTLRFVIMMHIVSKPYADGSQCVLTHFYWTLTGLIILRWNLQIHMRQWYFLKCTGKNRWNDHILYSCNNKTCQTSVMSNCH